MLKDSATHRRHCSAKSHILVKENIRILLQQDDDITVDTIDDIAFCVESVSQVCDTVRNNGGTVLQEPHYIDCIQQVFYRKEQGAERDNLLPCTCNSFECENYVEKAVVKSSVGNVQHTLLDKSHFKGYFLPGFCFHKSEVICENIAVLNGRTQSDNAAALNGITHIDHIALAVPCGETPLHIKWYRDCLHMSRFKTNRSETKSGLVIQAPNGNGLRMLTLTEHPCSDVVLNGEEVEMRSSGVKFVFVESLKDEGSDQVQIFLKHHGQPGVQHVAFHTQNISHDAQRWLDNGVRFIKPPDAYYKEIEATLAKLQVSQDDIVQLIEAGILIDYERHVVDESDVDVDNGSESSEGESSEGYLYQVFTEPVFNSHTFFLELIQRDNAKGFGAGNVSALWRSLDSQFKELMELQ